MLVKRIYDRKVMYFQVNKYIVNSLHIYDLTRPFSLFSAEKKRKGKTAGW